MPPNPNYDAIVLSYSERKLLKKIIRRGKLLKSECPDDTLEEFLAHDLVSMYREQEVLPSGKVVHKKDVPEYLIATHWAKGYLGYHKRTIMFQRNLPIFISIFSLAVSIGSLVISILAFHRP